MAMAHKAIDIANFILQLAGSIGDNSIDNLKLNKMLYFAQGHYLAKYHSPLYEDEIQAWEYGPVIPEVYRAFKCCGANAIEAPTDEFDEANLSSKELELLIDVYNAYGRYTGLALKDMTHKKDSPWDKVYVKGQNIVIQKALIEQSFANMPLEGFELIPTPENIITAVPSSWDSEEDEVYD